MSAKVIAVAGASGFVGVAFLDALLKLKAFEIRILTRASSIDSAVLQGFKQRGASLHAVSYDDESSLVDALRGVDVLVSTVAGDALLSAQLPLIKAAKTAGVAAFFPSEYGGRFEDSDSPSPLIQAKKTVVKVAKESGLPVTALATGVFPEYCLIPPLGYDFANKKVTLWSDGNAKITWTSIQSIAQWIAHVLKNVPIEKFQNKPLTIQGDLLSGNEIVQLWEKKHNAKLEVEYKPLKELEERIKANPGDFLAVLLHGWYSGQTELRPLNNDLYPEWKPNHVESVL
ncbi:NAD(P)-binding protein [Ceratobasidium sp. AG-I]|nr:NAD(P)-binding protein [Ceratobasidium sp. AG-I]